MNTPLDNLFAELEDLNRKIIELCCNHRRYADKIPDALNDYMAEAAYTEYVKQHEIHLEKLTAAAETELYNIKTIAAISTPEKHRRWYWPWSFKSNDAAKATDAKFSEHAEQLLEQILNQAEDMKDEFCRSWTKLLQENTPANVEEPATNATAPAGEAPTPSTTPAQETAAAKKAAAPADELPAPDAHPAQKPADEAPTPDAPEPPEAPEPPAKKPTDADALANGESWEEWEEEPNDAIIDKNISNTPEG